MDNNKKTNFSNSETRMKEMSFSEKHRANVTNRLLSDYFGLVIMLAVILVLSLAYYYVLKPKYEKIVVEVNANFSETEQLNPKYQELEKFKNLLRSYQALAPETIKRVDDLIPAEYAREDLFVEMIDFLTKKGFTVNSLDITTGVSGEVTVPAASTRQTPTEKDETNPADTELPVNIGKMHLKLEVAKIDYQSLINLLAALENNLRLMDVTKISFNPNTGITDLEVDTYYVKK